MTKYAIFFAGGANLRHINDMEFLYRTLTNVYGYASQNIHVLSLDGGGTNGEPTYWGNGAVQTVSQSMTLPGTSDPYSMVVTGAGTASALSSTMSTVGAQLTPGDTLLIHTNNHGSWDTSTGDSYLCSYTGGSGQPWGPHITATTFGSQLQSMNRCLSLMVMMEQCGSGGFQQSVLNSNSAALISFASATADSSAEGSAIYWPNEDASYKQYDGFSLYWIAALNNGRLPNGTALGSSLPSNPDMASIYATAAYYDLAHKRATSGYMDLPQFGDLPMGCGYNQDLTSTDLAWVSGGGNLTSASGSQEQTSIVFTNNRSSSVWIYQANSNGGNGHRLTQLDAGDSFVLLHTSGNFRVDGSFAWGRGAVANQKYFVSTTENSNPTQALGYFVTTSDLQTYANIPS